MNVERYRKIVRMISKNCWYKNKFYIDIEIDRGSWESGRSNLESKCRKIEIRYKLK